MVKKSTSTLEREQQQLALCRQLIVNHSFHSQQEIKQAFQQQGFRGISQSTISKLMKLLNVVKITNARGEKIYALNPVMQAPPNAVSPLSTMVISADFNDKFVIIHVAVGYARAVARVIEYHNFPEVLGIVAINNSIWVAPRNTRQTRLLHHQLLAVLYPPLAEAVHSVSPITDGIAS